MLGHWGFTHQYALVGAHRAAANIDHAIVAESSVMYPFWIFFGSQPVLVFALSGIEFVPAAADI